MSAVIAIAYANSLKGPFFFDDVPAIENNPTIRNLLPIGSLLLGPPQTTVAGRPVVNLSLAFNYLLGGLNVAGYHVLNILLHLINAWLLFALARQTLLGPALRARLGGQATPLALMIAAIWAVHPLATEAVTYVVQRTELLMALFYLATLYASARAAQAPGSRWALAAVGCCALGMASKEVMVSAPLAVVLYDRIFWYPGWVAVWRARRKLYGSLAASWIVLIVLLATGPRTASVGLDLGMKWWQYAGTQCQVMLMYLRLACWPRGLCVDYGSWIAQWPRQVLPGMVVIAGLLLATAWAVARHRPVGFLLAIVFLVLAPTSSVLPIVTEVAAERRMYLPLAALTALTVLFAWSAGYRLTERWLNANAHRRRWLHILGWGAGGGLICLLAASTAVRNSDYRSKLSIFADTVAKRPENARAQYNLGLALYHAGDPAAAEGRYRETLRLDPYDNSAQHNLGVVLAAQSHFQKAIECYRKAIRRDPNLSEAYNNLGQALRAEGRVGESVAEYRHALALDDKQAVYHANLADALLELNDLSAADQQYRAALQLDPSNATAHNGLGVSLQSQGRLEEAHAEYEDALRYNPQYPEAHMNLANYFALSGKLEAAVQHYQTALRLDPRNEQAAINLRHVLSLLSARASRSGS